MCVACSSSRVNRMTVHNLALVFISSFLQVFAINADVVRLMKELVIHHTIVFLVSLTVATALDSIVTWEARSST